MIVPENTNPLTQGVVDLVTAEIGTLGHFLSTPAEQEDEGEEGGSSKENPDHYGITIGHVLQDGTEQATMLHLSNNFQESELTALDIWCRPRPASCPDDCMAIWKLGAKTGLTQGTFVGTSYN